MHLDHEGQPIDQTTAIALNISERGLCAKQPHYPSRSAQILGSAAIREAKSHKQSNDTAALRPSARERCQVKFAGQRAIARGAATTAHARNPGLRTPFILQKPTNTSRPGPA
jgi:hypothetical protein